MSSANSITRNPSSQKPGRPSYEELQPRFEWEDNASSHVLNVFLPGFVKEQLKLTYDEPTRSLNVRGERVIGTGRFVRFNKDFKVPDNARFNEMRARFQSETLTVTIPKQTLNNKSQERNDPGKLPPTGKKVYEYDRMENDRQSTLIPPNPPPKPVPTPARWTEAPKANNEIKDTTAKEKDESLPLKEMKVRMEEERKLMVNVVMAAIVLVAVGAYICYYTLAMGGRRN